MYRHIVTPAARALAARAGGVTATRLQAAFGIVYLRAFWSRKPALRAFSGLVGAGAVIAWAHTAEPLPPSDPPGMCSGHGERNSAHTESS